jgi:RNA polymerase sigma-70 factor (ECF subfamily)
MIDYIRKNKRIVVWEETYENMHFYTTEYSDTEKVIEDALKFLPPAQKSVLILRDYEDLSYKEIEEITGYTEAQVKVYIHRARSFVKNYVTKVEDYFQDGTK